MLIDWLTLRHQITDLEEQSLYPLMPYLATLTVRRAIDDEVLKTKLVVDVDQVRSDFQGMVWSISSNGKDKYLNIGASPAFLANGNNLFGSDDYQACKIELIRYAQKVFKGALVLSSNWHPRRIDITQNYLMQSNQQVKEALYILRSSDGIRQKATVRAGDTVYFGAGSHFIFGKAYDKFAQAVELCKKSAKQLKPIPYSHYQLSLIDRILRLELTLGRQFFDEHSDEEILTPTFLAEKHETFFRKFIGDSEVYDMDSLYQRLIETCPSAGRAQAAYDTYLRIKDRGYAFAEQTMSRATFLRHRKYLIEAGLSISDLKSARIVELRKRRIDMQPVQSWEHLEQLLKVAA